ncbi:MAG: ribosome biogenesis GTPase [Hyphomicrobiaceae bacterium]|jgi:ribosome biogenesis GTPase
MVNGIRSTAYGQRHVTLAVPDNVANVVFPTVARHRLSRARVYRLHNRSFDASMRRVPCCNTSWTTIVRKVTEPDATNTGLVVTAYGRRGFLETDDNEKLRYLVKGPGLRVVCGDRVLWQRDGHRGKAIVQRICDRDNILERQPAGRTTPELLAANLDCIVVVCTTVPETNWFLLDRFLVTAALMGCRAIIVDNKIDLLDESSRAARDRELSVYRALDYACVGVSATNGQGIDTLLEELGESIAIMIGQSGVGKSSLINALVPDAEIVVGELSQATSEGRHTTTASIMHRLQSGARLIDTPGVRDFSPVVGQGASLGFGFPEIAAAAQQCRFHNCRHLQEPECAVKTAVELGTINARRFESYRRLIENV